MCLGVDEQLFFASYFERSVVARHAWPGGKLCSFDWQATDRKALSPILPMHTSDRPGRWEIMSVAPPIQ